MFTLLRMVHIYPIHMCIRRCHCIGFCLCDPCVPLEINYVLCQHFELMCVHLMIIIPPKSTIILPQTHTILSHSVALDAFSTFRGIKISVSVCLQPSKVCGFKVAICFSLALPIYVYYSFRTFLRLSLSAYVSKCFRTLQQTCKTYIVPHRYYLCTCSMYKIQSTTSFRTGYLGNIIFKNLIGSWWST